MLGCEELTYRRFRVLLAGLPTESRFKRAVLGDSARWTQTEHLLASLIDRVHLLDVHYLQSHGAKPKPKFKPIPRPGVVDRDAPKVVGKGKGMTPAELDAILGKAGD